MNADQKNVGRGFWLQWVIATTIGFIIGGAVSGAVVIAAETRYIFSGWQGRGLGISFSAGLEFRWDVGRPD